jgi:uncharacterized protein (TIGR02145 family)
MKKLTFPLLSFLILITAFLFRCAKEKEALIQEQEFFFALTTPDAKIGSDAKGLSGYNLTDARKIVLTIQNAEGTPTKYTSSELKIYQMNGAFFSQKLVLKTGSYRLTEFLIMDSTENVIFAAPLTGSYEAQNVTYPLPIAFEVIKDISSRVNVEVISTVNKSPEDFGLVSFPITEVKTITFLITVSDKESDRLLSAKLTITGGSYSHIQMLDSIAANRVTVKDSIGLDSYSLTIEKERYKIYNHLYTKDSLKLFNNNGSNSPLLVKLETNNPTGTVTDIDGNIYKTVKIGNQWWMAENLMTTRYSNGDSIPTDLSLNEWSGTTSGAYVTFNNDNSNNTIYGKLYNWFACVDNRNICPTDWHVPSGEEWVDLTTYLTNNGYGYGGSGDDIAKSMAATSGWLSDSTAGNLGNDQASNNSSGFTALPGGVRNAEGYFADIGYITFWWSTSIFIRGDSRGALYLNYSSASAQYLGAHSISGLSVRCLKDH